MCMCMCGHLVCWSPAPAWTTTLKQSGPGSPPTSHANIVAHAQHNNTSTHIGCSITHIRYVSLYEMCRAYAKMTTQQTT